MSSEQYFRCAGCGRFVLYKEVNEHYNSNHTKGIATESPPAPATVANPPPGPTWQGQAIPPPTPEPKVEFPMDILLMRKSYRKAFMRWTIIVFILSGLFWTNLYAWIVFHI